MVRYFEFALVNGIFLKLVPMDGNASNTQETSPWRGMVVD